VLLGIEATQPETEYGWIDPIRFYSHCPASRRSDRRFWEKRHCVWRATLRARRALEQLRHGRLGGDLPGLTRRARRVARPDAVTAFPRSDGSERRLAGSGSRTGWGSIQPYSVSGAVASMPSSTTDSGRSRATATACLTAVTNAPSSETYGRRKDRDRNVARQLTDAQQRIQHSGGRAGVARLHHRRSGASWVARPA